MRVEQAIIYAERDGFRALELDIYRPVDPPDRPGPTVVYVHGGGWRVSHRSRTPRETRSWTVGFFERLTAAGFVVVAPDYRLSGEATFPAQHDDLVDAVRWLHDHGDDLGIDAERPFLWGASAGGHLAALTALADGAPPVAGVVCWYPITDLTVLDQTSAETFEAMLLGGPIGEHAELAVAASPVSHVHTDAPPFLIQHGDRDTWVPCDQGARLAERLRDAGAPAELEIVPGADHFFEGAPDVEAIFDRALTFLLTLDKRRPR